MTIFDFIVVFGLVLSMIISLVFVITICNHIKFKAVSSITITDLTYFDCIICLYCFGIVYSSGIIGCLLTETHLLDFIPALIIGEAMFISVCYILCGLTITALLRLISLVTNSEESGIQTLGPDDIAIWKIRIVSHARCFGIHAVGFFCFQFIPGFFIVLSNPQAYPFIGVIQVDTYTAVYLVPLISALVSNLLSKSYAAVVNRKMKLSSPSHTKFLLSLNNSIAFVIIIAVQISGSYISRIDRCYFYYPMPYVVFGNVLSQNDYPTLRVPGNITEPPENCRTKKSFPVSLPYGIVFQL